MAVVDDLVSIERLCRKARNVTVAAVTNSLLVNSADEEGETVITLTPGQKAAIFALRAAMLSQIKTLAAGLPGA